VTTIRVAICAVLLAVPAAGQQPLPSSCAPDNAGLTLPAGFCAAVVADSLGRVRHLAVAPNGDVYAAVRGAGGGVLVLRDRNGDGMLEVRERFGPGGGMGIALAEGYLYFATDDAVVRWPWTADPFATAAADTVAHGLLARRWHAAKGVAVSRGMLYVTIGAPSNACQEEDRQPGSPGRDPCDLLAIAGGIWRFATDGGPRTQEQGERFATGLRNPMALAIEPSTGALFAMDHGQDDLHRLWPERFTEAESSALPAEQLFHVVQGGDYGWPYCYYDPAQKKKVLTPEYGGDGKMVGRCGSARDPALAFPAHWAPHGLAFYTGEQFPAAYRGGAFIAFHGSWNRLPPQGGYNVVFVPFRDGQPVGTWTVFASGFAGGDVESSNDAAHRPVGLAVGPDGSLYVSDDHGGRIYRISYRQ